MGRPCWVELATADAVLTSGPKLEERSELALYQVYRQSWGLGWFRTGPLFRLSLRESRHIASRRVRPASLVLVSTRNSLRRDKARHGEMDPAMTGLAM